MISTKGHSGKAKTMATAKGSMIARGWGMNKYRIENFCSMKNTLYAIMIEIRH